jgi:hypothetical protein
MLSANRMNNDIASTADSLVQQLTAATVQELSAYLEPNFIGEPGLGEGPTREFYQYCGAALFTVADPTPAAATEPTSTAPATGAGPATASSGAVVSPTRGAGAGAVEPFTPLFMPAASGSVIVVRPRVKPAGPSWLQSFTACGTMIDVMFSRDVDAS